MIKTCFLFFLATQASVAFGRESSPQVYQHACAYSLKTNKFPWACYMKGVDQHLVLKDLKLGHDDLERRCIRHAQDGASNIDIEQDVIRKLPRPCAVELKQTQIIKQYKEADI